MRWRLARAASALALSVSTPAIPLAARRWAHTPFQLRRRSQRVATMRNVRIGAAVPITEGVRTKVTATPAAASAVTWSSMSRPLGLGSAEPAGLRALPSVPSAAIRRRGRRRVLRQPLKNVAVQMLRLMGDRAVMLPAAVSGAPLLQASSSGTSSSAGRSFTQEVRRGVRRVLWNICIVDSCAGVVRCTGCRGERDGSRLMEWDTRGGCVKQTHHAHKYMRAY